jgi:phosphinothricin acetyltransferase
MEPSVRLAEPDDATRIADIYNAGIAERSSTFETSSRASADVLDWLGAGERFPVLVAVEAEVIGWARIAAYSERPAYAGVGEVSVYVDPGGRGRGVGTALLEALGHQARELGYWKLTGKLFPENEPSLRLVRRNGWREVGLHLRHGRLEGRWRDVLVMERLLAQQPQAPAPEGGASSPGP